MYLLYVKGIGHGWLRKMGFWRGLDKL